MLDYLAMLWGLLVGGVLGWLAARIAPAPPDDWCEDVAAFHNTFGSYQGVRPHWPPPDVVSHRIDLIEEEFGELMGAIDGRDLVGVADAVADLCYVVIGLGVAFGIDMRPIWRAVHESNMRKEVAEGPATKIRKPEGWEAPDIAGCLAAQGWGG